MKNRPDTRKPLAKKCVRGANVATIRPSEAAGPSIYHAQVSALKRAIVERALVESNGSYTDAARTLDVSPSFFRRLALDFKLNLP
jgi:hypothetical protein